MRFKETILNLEREIREEIRQTPTLSIESKDEEWQFIGEISNFHIYEINSSNLIQILDLKWANFKSRLLVDVTFLDIDKITVSAEFEVSKNRFYLYLETYLGKSIKNIIISPIDLNLWSEVLKTVDSFEEDPILEEKFNFNYEKVIFDVSENKKSSISEISEIVKNTYFFNCIWGPPGTGKTRSTSLLINELLIKKETSIIASLSHQAVDNILLKFSEHDTSNMPVIRLGLPLDKNYEKLKKYLPENVFNSELLKTLSAEVVNLHKELETEIKFNERLKIINQIQNLKLLYKDQVFNLIIENRATCFTTVAQLTLNSRFKQMTFDNLIIEEASMVSLPIFLNTIHIANKRILIVGDPRQLPPVVLSNQEKLKESAFNLYKNLSAKNTPSNCLYLNTTYRLPFDLTQVISERVYENNLNAIKSDTGKSINLIDLAGQAKNINGELSCIKSSEEVVKKALDLIISDKVTFEQIGIITPFRNQRRLIIDEIGKYELQNINLQNRVLTIHASQGDEFDYVLFDFAQYGEFLKPNEFFKDQDIAKRLLNVALTRTKKQIFIYYDSSFVSSNRDNCPFLFNLIRTLNR